MKEIIQPKAHDKHRNIVVDFSYLLEFTYSLARRVEGKMIYVPSSVVDAAEEYDRITNRNKRTFKSVMEKARDRGYIVIVEVDPEDYLENFQEPAEKNLTPAERGMVAVWEKLRQKGVPSTIVTDSTRLASVLTKSKIEFSTVDRERVFSSGESSEIAIFDHELEKDITSVKFVEVGRFVRKFILGGVLSILISLVVYNFKVLLGLFPTWLFAAILSVSSIFIFAFREKHRAIYGSTEFIVGLISLYYVLLEIISSPYNTGSIRLSLALKVLGTVYVMVRGVDNIHKSMDGSAVANTVKRLLKLNG